jgi:Bacterial Ig domain
VARSQIHQSVFSGIKKMFSELISEPFGQIAVYLRGLQKFGQAQLGAAALFCTLLLIGTAASAQGAAALTCSPTVSPTSVPRGGGYTVTANCGGTPAANGYTYRFPDLQFSDGPTAGSTYTVAPNTALSSQPGSRRIEVSNSNGATGVVFIDVRGQLACAPTATPSTATVGDVVTLVGACTEDGVALPASAFSTGGYAETWTVSGIGTIPRRAVPVTFTVPPNTTPGTIYTASVVATNNNAPSPPTSSSTTSASITVAAPATVSIATPANGANFPVPASIPLTANATAPGTTITQVDYLFPDGSVGSATTPPFAYNWAIGVPGTYQITPRVIPAVGSAKFGTSITVTVGTPATVSIATPSSGDSFPAPATIPLTANASAPGTTITRVDYVLVDGTPIGSPNGQVIGSATAPPFAFNWPNIGPGTYRIVPRVVPAVGSPTFGLTITVVVGTPATVGITTPVSGATFTAPATIPLTATATAPGTTVTRVDYVLSDGSVIGSATTPPFALNWSNGGAGVGVGNYFIRPRVVPSVGPTQEGAQIFIRVNFAPATVVITAPADDSTCHD